MTAKAFFLPIETRPKSLPPLQKMVGKFWHTGIIHEGKVYECFNFGRNSVSEFDEKKKEDLAEMKAVFVDIDANEKKLKPEISSGTDCSEYVARVVGMSQNTGDKKEFWPEQVYDFLVDKKQL